MESTAPAVRQDPSSVAVLRRVDAEQSYRDGRAPLFQPHRSGQPPRSEIRAAGESAPRYDRTHHKPTGEFFCTTPVPAVAVAVVRWQRVRGLNLRDRLVPVVATGGRFVCGFIGCVVGDL